MRNKSIILGIFFLTVALVLPSIVLAGGKRGSCNNATNVGHSHGHGSDPNNEVCYGEYWEVASHGSCAPSDQAPNICQMGTGTVTVYKRRCHVIEFSNPFCFEDAVFDQNGQFVTDDKDVPDCYEE